MSALERIYALWPILQGSAELIRAEAESLVAWAPRAPRHARRGLLLRIMACQAALAAARGEHDRAERMAAYVALRLDRGGA